MDQRQTGVRIIVMVEVMMVTVVIIVDGNWEDKERRVF